MNTQEELFIEEQQRLFREMEEEYYNFHKTFSAGEFKPMEI